MPYIDSLQKGGLTYAYSAWQDVPGARQRVERDGVETVLTLAADNKLFQVFPAGDELTCWQDDVHGGSGPTASAQAQTQRRRLAERQAAGADPAPAALTLGAGKAHHPEKYLGFLLPDLREARWRYNGSEAYRGPGAERAVRADVYEWDLSQGGMPMVYRFWVDPAGPAPLRLWMLGVNLYTGGHKDVYIAEYSDFKVGPETCSWRSPPGAPRLALPA